MKYYPLYFHIERRKILVVGGGSVAERKIKQLVEFNPIVTLIAPKVTQYIEDLSRQNKINWEKRSYQSGDAQGYSLIIATTDDPDVNQQIFADASKNNIPLNIVDKPELCTVIFPAMIRRGNITIAVSSDGKAPFFTKTVKEILNTLVPHNLENAAEMAAIFRKWVRSECSDEMKKLEMYVKFINNVSEAAEKWSPQNPPYDIWESWLKELK